MIDAKLVAISFISLFSLEVVTMSHLIKNFPLKGTMCSGCFSILIKILLIDSFKRVVSIKEWFVSISLFTRAMMKQKSPCYLLRHCSASWSENTRIRHSTWIDNSAQIPTASSGAGTEGRRTQRQQGWGGGVEETEEEREGKTEQDRETESEMFMEGVSSVSFL